jgi:hypothetical protein
MKNSLLPISAIAFLFLLSCSNKAVTQEKLPADSMNVSAADTMTADTLAQRNYGDSVSPKESNPAPSSTVREDTVKHFHEHGSPTKAFDDSVKAAKTKSKFK